MIENSCKFQLGKYFLKIRHNFRKISLRAVQPNWPKTNLTYPPPYCLSTVGHNILQFILVIVIHNSLLIVKNMMYTQSHKSFTRQCVINRPPLKVFY